MKLRFPETFEELEEVTTKEHLGELLKNLLRESSIAEKMVPYKLVIKKEHYLYATCRKPGCKAHLRYHLKTGRSIRTGSSQQ